jgi:tRNA nucleotidyltransferase (CCA-adding enzyme)
MHIILTHEQADFDALASMLGAYLLDESAIPVLPRRMNRNISAFVTLYGVELPFVDPRDLSGNHINSVTLVDTQSMVSIKGMDANTSVQVIDHHPRRDNLPSEWEVTINETGANTTLFVEVLGARDSALSTIEATLLLLGIYEDTGSLTYSRTTSRDLNAAAFLLERGANLEIATDFLNHPLSIKQQRLYDELRTAAQTSNIHGHTIVVASGDAKEMTEELSTIAHKMRDLLDPDALFLLVTTRGGVQLIARSNSADIDVARIAESFGGGGHERAAASMIKDGILEEVLSKLNQTLPTFISPAITVGEIMSTGPQLISPDTPAEEVSRRMQRYGYEGYPVVKNGQIIGLLTRRAVDRALSHKLNLTAERLMNAGTFTVHPDDSIEHVQHLMTETGWGQIPVLNPENGEVTGIVTRTDLLKTFTREPKMPGHQNLAERLEFALPAARLGLLKAISQTAHDQHAALYIVGGFVRDLLLDRPSLDFDLVVEGDAIFLAQTLADQFGGRITSHARFGTAKWHIAGTRSQLTKSIAEHFPEFEEHALVPSDLPESLDLITARTEFYTHPTALPIVERGSIKLDLHRRDFTINTLALRLDGHHYGELQDHWGGLNDLRQGLVRVLHSLSFVDDPTRMLRAVRFEKRFDFKIDNRTLDLLHEARPMLGRVSGDRIRHELDHILAEKNICFILSRLAELELLSAIHKSLTWDDWICSKINEIPLDEPDDCWGLIPSDDGDVKTSALIQSLSYIFWLIRLPVEHTRSINKRLKVSRLLAANTISACNLWTDLPSLINKSPSQIVSRLVGIPPTAIYAAYLASDDIKEKSILKNYVTKWKNVSPTIDGHTLRNRGLPPSPDYREILITLRDAWLDGEINTPESEAKLLDELITRYNKENER